MYLLAVSGGPDSMFLLNEYHRRKIVVAHVNYNLRKSSKRDLKIVQNYCNYHGITLEILNIKTKPNGNIESWAREIRYNFFKEIYDKYNCKKLLTAHHRDDFLETALMQQKSGRKPLYYGIKNRNNISGMNVYRPYINMYWKNQIINDLKAKNINYGLDETNKDLKFTRNRIRHDLKSWTLKEKRNNISWFKMSNKILKKKEKKINSWYKFWAKTNFSTTAFKNIKKYKEELIFKYVHDNSENINLNSKKINSIILFVEGNEGNKIFKLNQKISILKKDKTLKII